MRVPPSDTERVSLCPPYSRSRGGQAAGSSDQPDRRDPLRPGPGRAQRERGEPAPTNSRPPEALVMAARRLLLQQRADRVAQLAQLDADDAQSDVARQEIHVALLAAARSLLAEIDAALCRIEQGRYGRCHHCGRYVSWDRLQALPMSSLCGSCQRVLAEGQSPAAGVGRSCSGQPSSLAPSTAACRVNPGPGSVAS